MKQNLIFNDHFAPVATDYARFRPIYPQSLFAWLAENAPGRNLAWDCGTGSGQAARDLAGYFERVIATDASQAQLDAALPHPRIEYRVASAEASGLPVATVDLITVAQALHWFDLDRFYAEARRVLRAGGVLAVWSYGVFTVEGSAVDACLQGFYRETVGPYWPPERRWVENGYQTLPFPFPGIRSPNFHMTTAWSLSELLGYVRSWSATARYIRERSEDPVDALTKKLIPLWGDPRIQRQVTWPLVLRVGRN